MTETYPELQGLGAQLGATQVLLDGEIVALEGGRPSFGALQQRMHASAAQARRLAGRVPVTFLVFDVLHLDGSPTVGLSYERRRALLEGLGLRGAHWLTPRAFPGAGAEVLAASREQGLEGVVAKRLDSRYVPGRRLAGRVPVTFLVFDVLHLDGSPAVGLPYERRRALLEGWGCGVPTG